jgi:hypothetical protein
MFDFSSHALIPVVFRQVVFNMQPVKSIDAKQSIRERGWALGISNPVAGLGQFPEIDRPFGSSRQSLL